MSAANGPKVVTNGLLFNVDMSNGKSWKGTPTNQIIDLTGLHTVTPNSLSYVNNTFYFNGTTDYITVGSTTISANHINRAWEVVVNPAALQTTSGLLGTAMSGGCTYFCSGGISVASGKYAFNWFDNTAYQFLDSGIAATANQPVHIICTWNGADNKARIYVNGVLKATSGVTNLNYNGAVNEIQIGYLSASGNRYAGTINLMRYYFNRLLTDSEVSNQFNAVRSRYGI